MGGTQASLGAGRQRLQRTRAPHFPVSDPCSFLCVRCFDIFNISCKISCICAQSRSSIAVVVLSSPGLLSAHFCLKTPQISSEDT